MAGVALAALLVAAIVAAHAGAPYLFKLATLQGEVARQVRATTGLEITTEHARFGLLPRPHVVMAGVHVTDPSRSVELDAESLDGDVRLLPLIVGRVEMSSFNLARPKLRIDLDGASVRSDGPIGWAARASEARTGRLHRLGTVTFTDGTIALQGQLLRRPLSLTSVDVTVDWRDLDSPATLTGSLQVQHTPVDVAGWIAQPSHLMRGDRSTIAWRIHSTPLDMTANGDLGGKETLLTFKGHVAASAPSLDGLFALGTPELPLPAPFANMALTSDATVGFNHNGLASFDLQNLDVRADGNAYEGTLAYQGGPRPLVTGTLATGQLVLASFVAQVPQLIEPDRNWAHAPLPPLRVGSVDLDIRISAAHLRLAPLAIDEAALSVMTRGNRLEIGLNDGKAYGGTIKGRMSLGSVGGGVNIRAAGTIVDADLATLSWDAFGWQMASGTMSGSANVETTGNDAAALIGHLQGWAKSRASDGEVSGVDLGAGLRNAALGAAEPGDARLGDAWPGDARLHSDDSRLPILPGGRTAFSTTVLNTHFVDGTAFVDEATMQGPGAELSLAGTADLARRVLDLRADVQPPAASPAGASPRLGLDVTGRFDRVSIAPERGPVRPEVSAPGP